MTARSPRPPAPLAIALAWIAIWEPLVPAPRRTVWRDQWAADLWHYHAWLARERTGTAAAAWRLLVRAFAAFPHAVLLRTGDWSLHMLLQDLKFGLRMLSRRPAFTAVAVLVLGLGIGANATIYSWIETVLLEPMPGVRDQNQLVSLRGKRASGAETSFSYPNFEDVRAARPDGLEDVFAFRGLPVSLRADAEPMRVWAQLVTPNVFDVLRVRPAAGRTLTDADAPGNGGNPVAVISHRLWQRAFSTDPGIVGRAVSINGTPFTVVGVSEPGFAGTLVGVALDVFIPLTMQPSVLEGGNRIARRGDAFLQVFGRLKPGGSIGQVQASASVIAARLAKEHPKENDGRGMLVQPLWRDGASAFLLPVMATLAAVTGVVLLIACANLAGLLLARAAGRQREIAVRLAVGASRGRVIRQFLVESLLLAVAGGAAGIALSSWSAGLLNAFIPRTPVPLGFDAGFSSGVLGVAVLTTILTALAFGLLPAIRASRPDVSAALKDAAVTLSLGGKGRMRQGLVVAQLALSTLLLVCTALFVRSMVRAQTADTGFSLRQGIVASIDLLASGYTQERGLVFYQQVLDSLEGAADVEAASIAGIMPLDVGPTSQTSVEVEGYTPAAGEEIAARYNRVGPNYFETMGIEIVRGRGIDRTDVAGRELAVVINERMAARYWAGRDPVGSIIRYGSGPARVVGVARDGKYGRLNEPPQNYAYLSIMQSYRPGAVLVVRTKGAPEASLATVQATVKRLDASLPVFEMRTVEEYLRFSAFLPRMASTLLGIFGALALLLAVVGLYSVIAQTIALRTHEIGVRMALGADRSDVVRLVLRQGIVLMAVGIVLGLGLAAAAGRLIGGQLVGVSGSDPVSFAATAAILMCVSLLACAVPARQASALDPVKALRRD